MKKRIESGKINSNFYQKRLDRVSKESDFFTMQKIINLNILLILS